MYLCQHVADISFSAVTYGGVGPAGLGEDMEQVAATDDSDNIL